MRLLRPPRDRALAQAILVFGGVVVYVIGGPLTLYPLLLWLLPIVIAISLGESRGRTGWAWGLLLGWLGVLILAIMRPREPRAA